MAQLHVYGLEPCKLRRSEVGLLRAGTSDAAYGESPLGVCASHSQPSSAWWLAVSDLTDVVQGSGSEVTPAGGRRARPETSVWRISQF